MDGWKIMNGRMDGWMMDGRKEGWLDGWIIDVRMDDGQMTGDDGRSSSTRSSPAGRSVLAGEGRSHHHSGGGASS